MRIGRKKRRELEPMEETVDIDIEPRKLKKNKRGKKSVDIPPEQIMEEIQGQLPELERQIELSKREYEAVTSYLADMQKIDRLEPKEREIVNSAAYSISQITKERFQYQNDADRIPTEKYRAMERYEKILPQELKNLYEQEQYLEMVQSDLRQLDAEKAVIQYEKEQAEDKKQFLKNLSVGGIVMVVIFFTVLVAAGIATKADMMLPLLLTAAMATAMVAYIAATAANCERVIKESAFKTNRVIQLTNKVKIKLVNSTNTLEYCYEKYEVGSYRELAQLWEKYTKTREEQKRYRKRMEMLEQCSRQLVETLRAAGVKDAEIWMYQTEALLDEKEMVEVRHHLNTRRQKIRERLEINAGQLDSYKEELEKIQSQKQ